ncbi:MAG: triose-phosphate isomerase [Candidatus Eisenbacteria bacterium]|nr:triose-phosphate isomerase [Candidatus Eisenbacteria bacterium]
MNKTAGETRTLIRDLGNKLKGIEHGCEVLVCPPFVALETAVDAAKGTVIEVGAQNASWQKSGALTGEVSPEMLEYLGVTHVILGHSERRSIFGETDETVNARLRHVLSGSLVPIVCVGEGLADRESDRTGDVVRGQLRGSLAEVPADQADRLILAYEPVWAIGTGRTASPEMAAEVHALIRGEIAAIFGDSVAEGMRVLYGGSVKPENAAELLNEDEIDGVLVGGASLDASSFAAIIAAVG